MKKRYLSIVAATTVVAGLLSVVHAAGHPQSPLRVKGERAWAKAEPAAVRWREPQLPTSAVTKLTFRELPLKRIQEMHLRNRRDPAKPTQVGIARAPLTEGVEKALPALRWSGTADGGAAARIEVRSPAAVGLRVGLALKAFDSRAELRVAGSDNPSRPVAAIAGRDARKLADAAGVYWTPSTDGATQIIEVYVPAGVSPQSIKLDVASVSHLLASRKTGFKFAKSEGDSGSCNVDTACRVGALGANFVKAKDSVAQMVFVQGSDTYICTGTLLGDTVTTSQIPYFYSANHCISDQTVASTLETVWKFEATSCGSGVSTATSVLGGGATYLYSDGTSDALLLRLNQAPPAGATFSGWDSSPLSMPANVTAIHHPAGDLKKVSLGQPTAVLSEQLEIAWTSGTTEGGSSGSGLFTSDASGYFLRGGLYGGYAACANSGSVSNPENRDYYSRFDVVFPSIRQYLAPASSVRRIRDFNGDGQSDLLWRHAGTGNDVAWRSANNTTPQAIASVNLSWKIAGTGDFNADGKADLFWRNTSNGVNAIWLSANNATPLATASVANLAWGVAGIGDFNGDGKADVFWRNSSDGTNTIWLSANSSTRQAVTSLSADWQAVAVNDFNGDGKADILWRNANTGANAIWRSGVSSQAQAVTAVTTAAWKVAGSGDFNGDGKADILWRNDSTGVNGIWLSANSATRQTIATVPDLNWKVAAVGDYNGDGKDDVLWRHGVSGNNDLWYSGNSATHVLPARVADLNWKVVP